MADGCELFEAGTFVIPECARSQVLKLELNFRVSMVSNVGPFEGPRSPDFKQFLGVGSGDVHLGGVF